MAIGAGAFGQGNGIKSQAVQAGGVSLDALPKHPIPYTAFKKKVAKPKPKTTQTHASTPASPPPPPIAKAAAPVAPPSPRPTGPSPPIAKPAATRPAPPPSTPTVKSPSPTPASVAAQAPVAPPALKAPAPQLSPPALKPVATPPPLLLPQAGARLQPGQGLPPSELEAFIDGQVTRAMAGEHVAGVAVTVVQNGQLVMEKGYGAPNRSPAQRLDPRQSLIRLGSGSQIFTWIAALKAVEDGKLKLDTPINAALPDELKIPDEGFDKPILFRHLMSHTAGFEDRALGRRYVRNPDKLKPLETSLKALRPRRVRGAGLLSIHRTTASPWRARSSLGWKDNRSIS